MTQIINTETSSKEKSIGEEYKQFLTCREVDPPQKLSEQILYQIHLDLSAQHCRLTPKSFFICLLIVTIGLSFGFALRSCHLNSF